MTQTYVVCICTTYMYNYGMRYTVKHSAQEKEKYMPLRTKKGSSCTQKEMMVVAALQQQPEIDSNAGLWVWQSGAAGQHYI